MPAFVPVRPLTLAVGEELLLGKLRLSKLTQRHALELNLLVNTYGVDGCMSYLADLKWMLERSGLPAFTLSALDTANTAPAPNAPCTTAVATALASATVRAQLGDMSSASRLLRSALAAPGFSTLGASVPELGQFLQAGDGLQVACNAIAAQPASITPSDVAALLQFRACTRAWIADFPKLTSLPQLDQAIGSALLGPASVLSNALDGCASTNTAPASSWAAGLPFPPAGGASWSGPVNDIITRLLQTADRMTPGLGAAPNNSANGPPLRLPGLPAPQPPPALPRPPPLSLPGYQPSTATPASPSVYTDVGPTPAGQDSTGPSPLNPAYNTR